MVRLIGASQESHTNIHIVIENTEKKLMAVTQP